MNLGTSKTIRIVGLAALAALAAVFVVSVQRGAPSPSEEFTPPVYGTDGAEQFITLPLLLDARANTGGLSAEQRQGVSDFKKLILARVTSQIPLKETEKSIISASISPAAEPSTDGSFIADQRIFQFTPDELRLISEALQK